MRFSPLIRIPHLARIKIEFPSRAPGTGGSVGWASGCNAEGREFDSGLTNTQGLKITEYKVLHL